MSETRLLDLIERIQNLVTYEEKKVLNPLGLQSIHLKVLRYLSVCNKYSNTPYAVSEFLGNTKGTTSQSLKLLQNKGYLTKSKDKKDKRGVHIELTNKGYELLDAVSKKSDCTIQKDPILNRLIHVLRVCFWICSQLTA